MTANCLIGHVNYNGDVTTYGYDGANNRVSMNIIWGNGNAQNQYPSGHPAGVRDGWETQYKQQQRNIYFANDITLALPEPIMATDANDRSWMQSYVYGAGDERISMSYMPSTDPSNDWNPTPGTGGNTSSTPMKTLYYLENSLGSVIGLQAQDGTISARYHYDEFGIVEDAEKFDLNYPGPDNLFGYTGLGYDFNSGLSYARARYLDSSIGRFISEDTYEGDTKNPLSLNLYTYVYNNPLKYVDLNGNKPYAYYYYGKWYMGFSDKFIQTVRDSYGFIPWAGGYLLEGVDWITDVHQFNSKDINGAKKIIDMSNEHSLINDFIAKLGNDYAKKRKKHAKVVGAFSKILGGIGYASTIEDLLQTNFGYKDYDIDEFIDFHFSNQLVADSTDVLLAKYLYIKARVLQLVEEGSIVKHTEKEQFLIFWTKEKVVGWGMDYYEKTSIKSEVKLIR